MVVHPVVYHLFAVGYLLILLDCVENYLDEVSGCVPGDGRPWLVWQVQAIFKYPFKVAWRSLRERIVLPQTKETA